jgi:hypothetical protein
MIYSKTILFTAVTMIIGFSLISSCTKNNTEEMLSKASNCDTLKTISFKNDVQPILNNNCGAQAGCHSNGSASGGVKLESWSGAHEVAQTGLLLKAIRHESGVSAMPKDLAKLDDCYIAIISKWVRNGSLNN